MEKTVQLLRGVEVKFSEVIPIYYQLGIGNIKDRTELRDRINFANEGKLRTYLTVLRKYNLLENKGYNLSDLGKTIFEYDMNLNNEATLWLLHYLITSNEDNVVFYELFGTYFQTYDELELKNSKEIFEKYNFPETTINKQIRKEIRAGLKLYLGEEPFSKLLILESENLPKQNIKYTLNRNMLKDENIFLLLLYFYRDSYLNRESSVSIKEIINGEKSPGLFCLLDEYSVREMLESLHKNRKISVETRADLDQIRFLDDRTFIDIFKEVI